MKQIGEDLICPFMKLFDEYHKTNEDQIDDKHYGFVKINENLGNLIF